MEIQKHLINETAWVELYHQNSPALSQDNPLPALIICPGGSYEHISERESEPLAFAFLAQGYQVFILNYTVMNKGTHHNFLNQNLQEVRAVFELINKHHRAWNIDPQKVFLLGCSAGGHLAASYCTSHPFYQAKGLLLCYPVTSFSLGWPKEHPHFNFPLEDCSIYDSNLAISAHTPPTFIWHTGSDLTVPIANSLVFCEHLAKVQVPFEAHFFEKGPHGLGLANRATAPTERHFVPDVQRWFPWALNWLERHLKK